MDLKGLYLGTLHYAYLFINTFLARCQSQAGLLPAMWASDHRHARCEYLQLQALVEHDQPAVLAFGELLVAVAAVNFSHGTSYDEPQLPSLHLGHLFFSRFVFFHT